MHRPDPRELAPAKLTVHDRHKIQIASPDPESSGAGRADNVERLDAPGNRSVQPPEQIINGLLRRGGQHGRSVTERPTLGRATLTG